MLDVKNAFSRFRQAQGEWQHFAAHSHHWWPDVTHDAQMQAWQDAADHADMKWEKVLGELLPAVQRQIAALLGLSDPSAIAFAPNVHELMMRLISALPKERKHILTTDSEFHSASRQFARLEEEGWQITRVATEPFDSFPIRFIKAAQAEMHDLTYLSQVFFNSGFALEDLTYLVQHLPKEGIIAVDGYHGFMAVPTDISVIEHRIFYLSGGYKYAMAGEGVCFMHCPPGQALRPVDTGWFAAFDALESGGEGVPYGQGGMRMMGSTFDPSGLYRFHAVQQWLEAQGVTVESIHDHVRALQSYFMNHLREVRPDLAESLMAMPARGHFLTFRTQEAKRWYDALKAQKILTDYRGDRLRFGFGLYHQESDLERVIKSITGLEG